MQECVCCGTETRGTYNNKFPVCYHCYGSGDLAKLFHSLVNRHTIRLPNSLNKYLEQVNYAADKWYECFIIASKVGE